MKEEAPWSLRDNPASLTIATLGLLCVILALGWLTVRMGTQWTHSYLRHHTQSQASSDAD